MNKFKKAIASIAVAATIATGGVAVSAPAANAYSDSYYGYWQDVCKWQYRNWMVWRDYNWAEEVFQFKRDGWVRQYTQWDYKCYYY